MTVTSRELAVYAMNNRDIYNRCTVPTLSGLAKHKRRGNYDDKRAVAGMMHVATAAAKAYVAEFCLPGQTPWHKMFSVADRREAAEEMLAHYSEDINERAE